LATCHTGGAIAPIRDTIAATWMKKKFGERSLYGKSIERDEN